MPQRTWYDGLVEAKGRAAAQGQVFRPIGGSGFNWVAEPRFILWLAALLTAVTCGSALVIIAIGELQQTDQCPAAVQSVVMTETVTRKMTASTKANLGDPGQSAEALQDLEVGHKQFHPPNRFTTEQTTGDEEGLEQWDGFSLLEQSKTENVSQDEPNNSVVQHDPWWFHSGDVFGIQDVDDQTNERVLDPKITVGRDDNPSMDDEETQRVLDLGGTLSHNPEHEDLSHNSLAVQSPSRCASDSIPHRKLFVEHDKPLETHNRSKPVVIAC